MHFACDFYSFPDVKHSIRHRATKKEGALLVRAGFSKQTNKPTKNHTRKRATAHSCREQGVTAEEEQRSAFSLRDFP